MKYQEKYSGSKDECLENVKIITSKLIKETLEIDSKKVVIPDDTELEYKVKFEEDVEGGQFVVKITWSSGIEEEDEDDGQEQEEEA